MKNLFTEFGRNRRGTVALIFALALMPMVFTIAFAIDFSFFAEARSQIQLAADAAATHAIRTATGTYALETNAGVATGAAQADAIAAGNNAGDNWFTAQLGALPTAYVAPGGTNTNPKVNTQATTNPAGFSATVAYNGQYPPFFDRLFGQTANWTIGGTAGAAAQYSYTQILMLLDTSQSMDIGADLTDITTMEQNTVCVPGSYTYDASGANINDFDNIMYVYDSTSSTVNNDNQYNVDFTKVQNYVDPNGDPNNTNGTCKTGTSGGVMGANYFHNPSTGKDVNVIPQSPCAFACHIDNTLAPDGKYTADLYGVARRLGVNLRIDEVFAATENVIQTMISIQQASKQYSIGVYQFNDDVSPLTPATQGSPGSGDLNYEATYNLPGALNAIELIDYKKNPSETTFPILGNANASIDTTNFPLSARDLIKGNATNGQALTATSMATAVGSSISNPIKDIFIVTDGLEDDFNGGVEEIGQMTGVASENGQTANAVCQGFKNLGYTVFVLYITYYPLPHDEYTRANHPATSYTQTDYPSFATAQLPQGYVEGQSEHNPSLGSASTIATPPDLAALQACASKNTNNQPDFYVASNSATINSQLSSILTAALSSAIRVTQ